MKRLKGLPRGRTLTIPVTGRADLNAGIQAAIGGLVIAWANAESVFLALLQLLMKESEQTAALVWYSHRTTQARLDLVIKLARARFNEGTPLANEIEAHVSAFRGPSGTRNFFCHATYGYNNDMQLVTVSGVTVAQTGPPLRLTDKWLDLGTLNEVANATVDLINLNIALWKTVARVEAEIGVRRIELPRSPPDAPPTQETHHPKDGKREPQAPLGPSQE